MLKYLRMDLYRLVKGKMLWVTLGFLLLMSCFMTFMMWLSTSPDFSVGVTAGLQVGVTDPSELSSVPGFSGTEIEDFTQNQANMWLTGGALSAIVSIVVALLFATDFTSGFVKNLPSSRRDRLFYYEEKFVLIVLLSAALLVFAIASFEVCRVAAGLTYANMGTPGEIAVWFGLSVVILSMYAALAAVVTWLTQSKVAGIATALVAGSTMLGGLAVTVLQGLGTAWEPVGKAMEWVPFYSYQLLRQGGEALLANPGDIAHIVAVNGGVLVVCAVIALAVCARKDV